MMKRSIVATLMLCMVALSAFSQAKKPTVMVVPSATWCNEMGFMKTYDDAGTTQKVPDYGQAFLNSGDLKVVITTINSMMQERGFPLKDLEQSLASIQQDAAEEMLATSSTSGDVLRESDLDRIKKSAKCDIILDLYWKVNQIGPRRSVTFNLRALDAYTNKQVGGATGTGNPTMTAELAILLQEAVQAHIDPFNDRLMMHFVDMSEKGREVSLNIRVWSNSEYDLESDLGGEELSEVIENWVSDHTVANVFNLSDATESMMNFEQVRIPLMGENGRPLDTRRWARGLSKHLEAKGVPNKLSMKGLGRATITIGEK